MWVNARRFGAWLCLLYSFMISLFSRFKLWSLIFREISSNISSCDNESSRTIKWSYESILKSKNDARTCLVLVVILKRNITCGTKVVKFSVIENSSSSFSDFDDSLLFNRESPRLATRKLFLGFQIRRQTWQAATSSHVALNDAHSSLSNWHSRPETLPWLSGRSHSMPASNGHSSSLPWTESVHCCWSWSK